VNDVETKVRQLIALALNSAATEGEARNAAISAIKLIEKHKLLNGEREKFEDFDRLAFQERIRFLESQVRGARLNDMILKGQIRSLNEALTRAHDEIAGLKREIMDEKRRKPPIVTDSGSSSSPLRRKIIRSQFAGTCSRCKERFEIGERIAWRSGGGSMHIGCYEKELGRSA
jgi:hypothetical protein